MSIRSNVRELPRYDFDAHPTGVKLDQNELAVDLPEALREELKERLARVVLNRYPELDARRLRNRLATMHDWPEDGVVVTPGSNVLIQYLVIAAGIGQTVITPKPTFGVYRMQASMLGANLVEVPMGPAFSLPVDGMIAEMQGSQGIVFLANPAAPTGNLHPREELERLIEGAGGRWIVVIDEAYSQFAGSDFSDLARRPSVVSLRTLSKAFGLAGARIGYALTEPELAAEVQKIVLPFAVSELQQAAALTMLDHHELVLERAREVAYERDRMVDALTEFPGVTTFPSVTNFILLRVHDGERIHRQLLRRGVAVRRLTGDALRNCLRVSIGAPQENRVFLAALRGALLEVEHG